MAQARLRALKAVARCSAQGGGRELVLADGTSRRTIGAHSLHGIASSLSGECEALTESVAALRELVDASSARFIEAVQPMQRGPVAMLAANGIGYASLAAVAHEGQQLEHFHSYHPRPSGAAESRSDGTPPLELDGRKVAVPLHTDTGLFIALVPALYVESTASPAGATTAHPAAAAATAAKSSADDGFYVVRRDGGRAHVAPAHQSSSVVFMLGDAWQRYVNPHLADPLRPAPHTMSMPASAARQSSALRVWYGRMYLPPLDAVERPGTQPFGLWQQHVVNEQRREELSPGHLAAPPLAAPPLAAPPLGQGEVLGAADDAAPVEGLEARRAWQPATRRQSHGARLLDARACAEDHVFCWMQCMCAASPLTHSSPVVPASLGRRRHGRRAPPQRPVWVPTPPARPSHAGRRVTCRAAVSPPASTDPRRLRGMATLTVASASSRAPLRRRRHRHRHRHRHRCETARRRIGSSTEAARDVHSRTTRHGRKRDGATSARP